MPSVLWQDLRVKEIERRSCEKEIRIKDNALNSIQKKMLPLNKSLKKKHLRIKKQVQIREKLSVLMTKEHDILQESVIIRQKMIEILKEILEIESAIDEATENFRRELSKHFVNESRFINLM